MTIEKTEAPLKTVTVTDPDGHPLALDEAIRALDADHLYPTRNLTTSIGAPVQKVYDFASQPLNLPKWASGLAAGIHEQDGVWWADSPMGRVRVEMVERNAFGILDHHVTLPSGQVVFNGLRTMPNRDGCEVVFTLFKTDDLDHQAFDDACAHVERDLATLKRLMS